MEKTGSYHGLALKAVAVSFGILGGLGGLVHGVGELLQDPAKPAGVFIASWAEGPIARYFDGDPAITVIPDMLWTGLLALLVSVTIMVWSAAFLERRNGGAALIVLSILLLLVGGGVGPPTLALFAGIAALGIHLPHRWWRNHLDANARRFFAAVWPYLFGLCLANGIFNVVGHVVAAYFFAPVNGAIFLYSFLLSVPLLLVSMVTGMAFDLERNPESPLQKGDLHH